MRKGFRGGHLLDHKGSLQLLNSSHVKEKDKALQGGTMAVGVWNGFLWTKLGVRRCPAGFAVVLMGMITCFGIACCLHEYQFMKILNFTK